MKCVSNFDEHCMVYLCIDQLNLQALAGREPQGGGAGEIRNPELVKAQYPTQDILNKKKEDTVPSRERSHLPPNEKRKTIHSKVPEREEICDRSQEHTGYTWIHKLLTDFSWPLQKICSSHSARNNGLMI